MQCRRRSFAVMRGVAAQLASRQLRLWLVMLLLVGNVTCLVIVIVIYYYYCYYKISILHPCTRFCKAKMSAKKIAHGLKYDFELEHHACA